MNDYSIFRVLLIFSVKKRNSLCSQASPACNSSDLRTKCAKFCFPKNKNKVSKRQFAVQVFQSGSFFLSPSQHCGTSACLIFSLCSWLFLLVISFFFLSSWQTNLKCPCYTADQSAATDRPYGSSSTLFWIIFQPLQHITLYEAKILFMAKILYSPLTSQMFKGFICLSADVPSASTQPSLAWQINVEGVVFRGLENKNLTMKLLHYFQTFWKLSRNLLNTVTASRVAIDRLRWRGSHGHFWLRGVCRKALGSGTLYI